MPNCLEWLVLYFAVAKLGATNVFVNTQYDDELLRHAFRASDVKAVMISRSLLPVYQKVVHDFSPCGRRYWWKTNRRAWRFPKAW